MIKILLVVVSPSLLLLKPSTIAAAAAASAPILILPDVGAIDGSISVGSSILSAGDRSSLLSSAGLSNFNGIVTSPDSPFATFNQVKNVASSLSLLHSTTVQQQGTSDATGIAKAMDSPYMPSQFKQYYELGKGMTSTGQDLSQCYNSVTTDGAAISDTWTQGISTTTQGRAAALSIDKSVAKLYHLNSNDKAAVKAGYALYDTWIKTGSPSHRTLQALLLNAAAGAIPNNGPALPSPLTGTYQTLGGAITPECKTAYKSLTDLYNQVQDNDQGSSGSNGGMPGLGGNQLGSPSSQGGMPGGESFSNPFGTSMSGQDPAGSSGLDGMPGTVDEMAGTDDPSSPTSSSDSPQVAESGTNKCKTFTTGTIGVQLCQGSTITATSATITGSVINVGQDTLCDLTLIIDQFELSSSYYPTWLPTYNGFFMPGDTITFGVTVPYSADSPRPQVDIDSVISVCGLSTTSPTSILGSDTSGSTIETPTDGEAGTASTEGGSTTNEGFDWANVGGMDTTCLKGCLNLIQDMGPCDAFDAIGAFRCDSCSEDTYANIQSACLAQDCGESLCHIKPMIAHSGASQSVQTSLSICFGIMGILFLLLL